MNKTGLMIDILKMELGKFHKIRTKFIEEFSEMDYIYIEKVRLNLSKGWILSFVYQGWKDKVVRCNAGDQAWGLFVAQKDFSK